MFDILLDTFGLEAIVLRRANKKNGVNIDERSYITSK